MAISVQPLAPLQLQYKPDAAQAQQRMRAYWAGEMIDRACVRIVTPKDGANPIIRSIITAPDFDFQRAVDDFEEWADGTFFGGEAMPFFMPNYGPDQFAGFFGANLTLIPDMDTSWVEPVIDKWDESIIDKSIESITLKLTDSKWYKSIINMALTAAKSCDEKFIIAGIDSHSNLDCISALRGPERLCMDLIEYPDEVLRALELVNAVYKPVYDAIYDAGKMAEFGSSSWVDMYSEARTQAVQCDFSYMVSAEHFRKFILPSLEYECSVLDHVVYHLDGVAAFRHLDDLLGIPNLHTIQLVPGAGQPAAPAWLDMLKRIQKAGKGIQVFVTPDELKAIYSELDPAKTFYYVLECGSETEARKLIDWMVANT